jgi:hypothetical protein
MKRFSSLFLQDLLLAYRSGHVFITVAILAIMLILVMFLPPEFKVHNELVYDSSPGAPLAARLIEIGFPESGIFMEEAGFRAALEKQPGKIGVIFSGSVDAPHFELIAQNHISEKNIGLLRVSLDTLILQMQSAEAQAVEVELLRQLSPPPPLNLNIIPLVLVFEVVLLGFFIVAVMMFQEKQEGTLRAYRVSPSGALNYVSSKTALFLALSLGYGLPILLAGFGLNANYPVLISLLLLSSSLMTMFSLSVAVFFRNLSEWFFVGVAVLLVNGLPMLSYALPGLAPGWLSWIPSYPAVFATRNVLFHGAGFVETTPTLIYLLTLNGLAFGAAYLAVRMKLLKEGR